jgi:hypothetical protein
MSALGQKRTCAVQKRVSAYPHLRSASAARASQALAKFISVALSAPLKVLAPTWFGSSNSSEPRARNSSMAEP